MFAGRRSPATDAAYRRSNAALGLPVLPSAVARGLAARILEASEAAAERRRLGQMLLDDLNSAAGLQRVQLVIADRPQVHQHDGRRLQSRTYGYYRCWFEEGELARSRIRIYHRTAVREQVIAPKVFLNTLLHEWTHHFDFAGLRLLRSPHTTGFYARLRALAEALDVGMVLPPERDAEGNPIAPQARAANTRVLQR